MESSKSKPGAGINLPLYFLGFWTWIQTQLSFFMFPNLLGNRKHLQDQWFRGETMETLWKPNNILPGVWAKNSFGQQFLSVPGPGWWKKKIVLIQKNCWWFKRIVLIQPWPGTISFGARSAPENFPLLTPNHSKTLGKLTFELQNGVPKRPWRLMVILRKSWDKLILHLASCILHLASCRASELQSFRASRGGGVQLRPPPPWKVKSDFTFRSWSLPHGDQWDASHATNL